MADPLPYANEQFRLFCEETENEEVKKCIRTKRVRGTDTPSPVVRSFFQYLIRQESSKDKYKDTKGKKRELAAIVNILGTLPDALASPWNKFVEANNFGSPQTPNSSSEEEENGEPEDSPNNNNNNNIPEPYPHVLIRSASGIEPSNPSLGASKEEYPVPQLSSYVFDIRPDEQPIPFFDEQFQSKRHKGDKSPHQ